MATFTIQISDDALMEMTLAALEAYVIPQRNPKQSINSIKTELETYGLLWGHEIDLPDGNVIISVRKLTVDAMAYRRNDSVWPSDGLRVIKDMITSFWPQYSFLGDFHSHPYEHYKDVQELNGYEFSEGDRKAMIANKQNDRDFRVSLVMTISSLKRASNSPPKFVDNHIISWTFNNYRFWLNACLIHNSSEENNPIVLSPNSTHWKKTYESDEIDAVYLHCSYLHNPWQVTRFGRKMGPGNHESGDI